jgi:uncharacterized protein YjiS (DUF1127 family)
MSTLTLPSRRNSGAFFHNVGSAVANFVAGVRDGHAMARRYEILSRMSDGQLATLGLRREDVPQAASKAVAKPLLG